LVESGSKRERRLPVILAGGRWAVPAVQAVSPDNLPSGGFTAGSPGAVRDERIQRAVRIMACPAAGAAMVSLTGR
jgi:hypothetical protein